MKSLLQSLRELPRHGKQPSTLKAGIYIILISLLPISILYLPFLLKLNSIAFLNIKDPGFINILRNWDGPHYIVIARSMYDLSAIEKLLFTSVPPSYYPAHFPLYPIFIALLAPLFGYFHSGLIVNILAGIVLNWLFYYVARSYTKHPFFLTYVFTIFPGRFFITRGIVAPETLMVLCIFASLILWEKKRYFSSSVLGSLGILTKIKAGFLFPAFMAERLEDYVLHRKHIDLRAAWSVLIPLTFLGLCVFYFIRTGDFFAFFNAEKENGLFITFPFAQFNSAATWTGTAWLEDVLLYFAGMFVLITQLARSKTNRSWFYFALIYTFFLVIVPQRDITRFSYPLYPLFLLVFQEFFTSRAWKIAILFLTPGIFFYAWNFILQNQAPLAQIAPFL